MVLLQMFHPLDLLPLSFFGEIWGTGSQELTDVLKHLEEVPLLSFLGEDGVVR